MFKNSSNINIPLIESLEQIIKIPFINRPYLKYSSISFRIFKKISPTSITILILNDKFTYFIDKTTSKSLRMTHSSLLNLGYTQSHTYYRYKYAKVRIEQFITVCGRQITYAEKEKELHHMHTKRSMATSGSEVRVDLVCSICYICLYSIIVYFSPQENAIRSC